MKGKRGNIKSKIFSNIYKQISIIAIVVFTIYIIIKTVQTQRRKKIEGFKEGLIKKEMKQKQRIQQKQNLQHQEQQKLNQTRKCRRMKNKQFRNKRHKAPHPHKVVKKRSKLV